MRPLMITDIPHLGGNPALGALYGAAMERLNLDPAHFFLISDLVEMCGDHNVAHLESFHALLLALMRAVSEGSVCIDMRSSSLVEALDFLERSEALRLAESISDNLKRIANLPVVSDGSSRLTPLVLVDLETGGHLFFQRWHRAELELKEALDARLVCTDEESFFELADVYTRVTEAGDGFSLGEEQKLAVALALSRRFLVISGGPGTGKTTVVATLIRAFLMMGMDPTDIRLAAPTGRAAKRLGESLREGFARFGSEERPAADRIESTTIHRLLRFNPTTGGFVYNAANPLGISLLVVDESSMVDLSLMAKLLRALPPTARLILIGDRDQLPSVDAGALLSDLLSTGIPGVYTRKTMSTLAQFTDLPMPSLATSPTRMTDHLAILQKTHRFDEEMCRVARRVCEGDTTVIDEMARAKSGFRFAEIPESSRALFALLREWFERHALGEFGGRGVYRDLVAGDVADETLPLIFAHLDHSRVLAVGRSGIDGVSGINEAMMGMLRRSLPPSHGGGVVFPSGTPLVITRNDYTRGLFNGETGVALRDGKGTSRAWFRHADGYASWPLEELPHVEPAFALTVHKAQGSEYTHVLVVLPFDVEHRLLTREIVYTALTRARRDGVIAGNREVFARALSRKVIRYSTLPEWLGASMPMRR